MKLTWISSVILISFLLLLTLKAHESSQFQSFYKAQPTIKLDRFEKVKKTLSPKELDLLELWESMLTGRSAPVSKWMKCQYKALGLNHLFTPSGFHLSAVLMPLMKFITNRSWQLATLFIIGMFVFAMPGQFALKRMILIKGNQHLLGRKTGFVVALTLDLLFGSFSESPLSFCYSFLFLGVIYSGSGWLFLWFFFSQALVAYFSGDLVSPLILVFSPFLNMAFALAMPFLFLLAFPLWNWQLSLGLKILTGLQSLVEFSASMSRIVPAWEIHIGVLACFLFFYLRKKRILALTLLVLSFSLNPEFSKTPSFGPYEFVPKGSFIKIVSKEDVEVAYWSDGRCKRELIRGIWWEKCSPRRRKSKTGRSTRNLEPRKFSSASSKRRKSFLHEWNT